MEITVSDIDTVVGKNYLVLYTLWKTLLPIMWVRFVTKVLEILQNVNQSYSLDKLSCRIFVHKCITLEVTYFLAGYNLLYLGEVHWGGGRKWPPHLIVHGVTPGSVLKHHPWWVQRTIWVVGDRTQIGCL